MATIAIVLKTTQKLKNNQYAIAIRVTHERQSRYYSISTLVTNQSLQWCCKKEDWKQAEKEDNGLGRFRKTFSTYKECNEFLKIKLYEAQNILKRYDDNKTAFNFECFEADLKKKDHKIVEIKQQTIHTVRIQDYYTQQILILEEQQREGLAGLYRENQSALKKFRPEANLNDVNFRFLESLEYWMRNVRGNMDTTISVKMRNLQRVINQAIEDGCYEKKSYPFGEKKYSINKRLDHSTRKIAIHPDKISRLKALELTPGSSLHFAQQVCLFSYYCRGMNFIDITFLKWSNVKEFTIDYIRRKTKKRFEIPLNEHNKEILTFFSNNNKTGNVYVFPIINLDIHVTAKQQYTRKKTSLKVVNDNLKRLANLIGEPKLKLSTNVLRHSYATGMKRLGANTSYISEALGHATEEQTQIYLAEFESGVIESWEVKLFNDEANK